MYWRLVKSENQEINKTKVNLLGYGSLTNTVFAFVVVICAYFIEDCVRLLQAKSEHLSSRKIILFSVSLICIYLYHAFKYLLFNLKRNNIPKFRKRFLDKLRTFKEVYLKTMIYRQHLNQMNVLADFAYILYRNRQRTK